MCDDLERSGLHERSASEVELPFRLCLGLFSDLGAFSGLAIGPTFHVTLDGVVGRGEIAMCWKVVVDNGETGRLRRKMDEDSCSAPLTLSPSGVCLPPTFLDR